MKRTKLREQPKKLKPSDILNQNYEPDKTYTLKELKKILKPSHQDFAKYYIVTGWNATKAYEKAYPLCSKETAYTNGNQLLKNAKIQQLISYLRDNCEDTVGISKQSQLQEYRKIAYSSIAHIHNSWITKIEWDKIMKSNPDALDAIESIDTKVIRKLNDFEEAIEVEYVKIKLHDKNKALENIDKLMGYKAAEKVEVDAKVSNQLDLSKLSQAEIQTILSIARKQDVYE